MMLPFQIMVLLERLPLLVIITKQGVSSPRLLEAKSAFTFIPPEEGSFKQTVAAAVLGAVIAVPFTIFIQRVIND